MIAFYEGKLFNDKRRNLIVYEMLMSILFAPIVMGFIEGELFHDKRRNFTVHERILANFIGME
jgi:hypothetical protein